LTDIALPLSSTENLSYAVVHGVKSMTGAVAYRLWNAVQFLTSALDRVLAVLLDVIAGLLGLASRLVNLAACSTEATANRKSTL